MTGHMGKKAICRGGEETEDRNVRIAEELENRLLRRRSVEAVTPKRKIRKKVRSHQINVLIFVILIESNGENLNFISIEGYV